jgi:Zn-dependent protease with chaperone function
MSTPIQIRIHPKENLYLALRIVAACAGYLLIIAGIFGFLRMSGKTAMIPLIIYMTLILLYLFFRLGIMVGYLKGNAIKLSQKQFPDIYKIVQSQCQRLNMPIPDVYIMEQGGLLNAFATQFMGHKYIVLYSDVLEEAYSGNLPGVEFVIGHELGHIKCKHLTKRLLLFPSFIVPFLNRAYSRACEYTCDNIGSALSPGGASQGLLLLAAGKQLWRKVNHGAFTAQTETESGFWHWFAEKASTHPHLNKRLARIAKEPAGHIEKQQVKETITIRETTSDHSAYLPNN